MINDLIEIDGVQIDIGQDIPVPINLSIADLLTPEKRDRNFSKTIDIPGSLLNTSYFYGAFSITVTDDKINFDATKKLPAIYWKRGVPIMPQAVIQLQKVTIVNKEPIFTIRLYSEFVDWFLLLQDIKVNEFDWSDYDHTLTQANIQASWTATAGSGYLYPLIEFGNSRIGTTIWRTIDFIPYVYMREVVLKCLEYAGLSHDSTFIDSTFFKKFIFGYGGGEIRSISATDVNQRKVDINNGDYNFSSTRLPLFQGNNPWVTDPIYHADFGFEDMDSSNTTYTEAQDLLGQFNNFECTIQRSGNYALAVSMILDFDYDIGSMTFVSASSPVLKLLKNGVIISSSEVLDGGSIVSGQSGTTTIQFTKNLSLNSGDVIGFRLAFANCKVTVADPADREPITLEVTTNTPITVDFTSTDTTIIDGSLIQLNQFLPSMTASDFMLGFMRQFYTYLADPSPDGEMDIEPLSGFYLPTSTFDDITELIDHSKPFEVRPSANEYPKRTVFNFAPCKEYEAITYAEKWGENYGDLTLEQGSYFAKGEKKISLPWGTIIPYEIANGILVPRFITFESNGTAKNVMSPPRIAIYNGLKTGNIQIRNAGTPASPQNLTSYPCIHHFDNWQDPDFDLNFKLVNELYYTATIVTTDNSFSRYYEPFISELTSPAGKIVVPYVKWDSVQIKNMNFAKLKMIDGALFRLNKIFDFDDNLEPTTKTELVKVLKAKSPRRGQNTVSMASAALMNNDPVSSPQGAGADTGTIGGGNNSTLANSNVIRG